MENLPAPPAFTAQPNFEIEDDYYQYAAGDKGVNSSFRSLEGAKKEYDQQNKYREEVSNKLGEKMLSGYAMLSTICPLESCRGTPLVRLPGKPMECVSCSREYMTSALGDLVPFNGNGAGVLASVPATPAVASAPVTAASASSNTNNLTSSDPSFFLDMNNAPVLDVSRY